MLSELSFRGLLVAAGVLIALLIVAAVYDLHGRRIPNPLVLFGVVSVVVLAGFSGSRGMFWSAAGLATGLAIFYPVYAAGWLGAGDVKLISLVGGFVGLQQLLPVILFITLAGGLLTMTYLLLSRAGWVRGEVPYAVAILMGVLAHFGFYQR